MKTVYLPQANNISSLPDFLIFDSFVEVRPLNGSDYSLSEITHLLGDNYDLHYVKDEGLYVVQAPAPSGNLPKNPILWKSKLSSFRKFRGKVLFVGSYDRISKEVIYNIAPRESLVQELLSFGTHLYINNKAFGDDEIRTVIEENDCVSVSFVRHLLGSDATLATSVDDIDVVIFSVPDAPKSDSNFNYTASFIAKTEIYGPAFLTQLLSHIK